MKLLDALIGKIRGAANTLSYLDTGIVKEATIGSLKGAASGLVRGLTLGYVRPKIFEPTTEIQKQATKIPSTLLELETWLIPFGLAEKGVGAAIRSASKIPTAAKVLTKAASKSPQIAKLVKSASIGAASFGAIEALRKPEEGEKRSEMLASGALLGASVPFLGAGLKVVGKPIAEKTISKELTAIQKVTTALKEAKPLRTAQEALYTKARGEKLAKALKVGEKVTGEKGYYAEKAALGGELPKVQFESIRSKISQADIDDVFKMIKKSPILNEWEKYPAREGLTKLLRGTLPTKNEISLLRDALGDDFTKVLLGKRTLFEKFTNAGLEIANIPRAAMASTDLSAPLRQGIVFAFRHPIKSTQAFISQAKAFVSEKSYQAINKEILERPTYKLMRANKLALTDVGSALSQREEMFMSSYAEKIPIFGRLTRASGRAYTTYLNKMRADVFDDFIKLGAKTGALKDASYLKSAASFVNTATGRGGLGAAEKAAVSLNSIFFSPRLTISRINMLNPAYYVTLHPTVRKEALKSLFAFAAGSLSIAGLAKLGGIDVEADPRNADFLKLKVGNTRYDTLGGFQQPIRAAAQFISGKVISSTTGKEITLGEGYKALTRADIIQRFLEYKEAPAFSFVWFWAKNQTAIGEKFDVPTEVINRFIPMAVQDMYDLYQEQGQEGIPAAIPAFFGVGVQTYGGVQSYGLNGKDYPELNEELNSIKATIGFPSTQAFGQELTNTEYKELKEKTGKAIAGILTEMIADPSWKTLNDNEKKKIIERVADRVKAKAKEKLFPKKQLQNEIKKRLVKKGYTEEEAKKLAEEIMLKESKK